MGGGGLTFAVDLTLVLSDVGALQPLVAAVAGETGLVVDSAASQHLLRVVHRLPCIGRISTVERSQLCEQVQHKLLCPSSASDRG